MAVGRKTRRILSYYARHQKRENGRFVKETEADRISKTEKAIANMEADKQFNFKERAEELKVKTKKLFRRFKYLIAMDYSAEKTRTGKWKGKGRHPFHAEYLVISKRKLDNEDIRDRIISYDDDYDSVLSACKLTHIKGVEVEYV